MPWWLWMLLGMLLAVLEVQVPSNFYLLAFGIGASLVGIIVGLFGGGPAWLQWLLFTICSVAAVLVLQRYFVKSQANRWTAEREIDSFIGELAIASEDLPAGAVGKVELRGSVWSGRNTGASAVSKGQRCRVEKVEGLTLWIRSE
ncbi:MAG: NfeD family protein [Candidatus Binatia bacterium]